jgi:hypothetical protein
MNVECSKESGKTDLSRIEEIELRSRFGLTTAKVLGQAAGKEEHSRTIAESRNATKKDVKNQKNKQSIGNI